jgi:predicted house-cleaning noncanonical NTP pyrophosphatase (MazG superfamily)
MIKKHRFRFNKLIRDKVLGFMHAKGVKVSERIVEKDEYIQYLKEKLIEEAHEVLEATQSQDLQIELADVLEVVIALCRALNISFEEVMEEREKKKQIKGGFENGIYVAHIEIASDHEDCGYYVARPKQYPEI